MSEHEQTTQSDNGDGTFTEEPALDTGNDGGAQGEPTGDGQQEAQPDQQTESGAQPGQQQRQPGQPQTRAQRRAEFSQLNHQLQQSLDEGRRLREQIAQLTNGQQQVLNHMQSQIPRAPDPHQERISGAQQKVTQALALMGKDPKRGLSEFLSAQAELSRAVAQAELAQFAPQFQQQIQGMIPREKAPELQAMHTSMPWLKDHEEAVTSLAKSIAADGRDMRNQKVFWATINEAALKVGRLLGLPVPQTQQRQPGRVPFIPAGHPMASTDGGAPDPQGQDWESIDVFARAMFPGIDDPALRRQAWQKATKGL